MLRPSLGSCRLCFLCTACTTGIIAPSTCSTLPAFIFWLWCLGTQKHPHVSHGDKTTPCTEDSLNLCKKTCQQVHEVFAIHIPSQKFSPMHAIFLPGFLLEKQRSVILSCFYWQSLKPQALVILISGVENVMKNGDTCFVFVFLCT